MCSSQVCAKLAQKFWSLLNQPASHGPFRPKLWTSLATVFVDIFWKEKNWVGFRPFPMTHWKEFLISWKKRRFEIFWSSWKSTLTLSTNKHTDRTVFEFFPNRPCCQVHNVPRIFWLERVVYGVKISAMSIFCMVILQNISDLYLFCVVKIKGLSNSKVYCDAKKGFNHAFEMIIYWIMLYVTQILAF